MINVLEVLEHFNEIHDIELLNQLFYCSLFDLTCKFDQDDPELADDSGFFTKETINELRELRRNLLCKKYNDDFFRINKKFFAEYERRVMDSDFLCRKLLWNKLTAFGLKVRPITKKSNFDLIVDLDEDEKKTIEIELKRIHAWNNHSEDFKKFHKKTKRANEYLYVILCTHPLGVEKIISSYLKPNAINTINSYILNIIESHYIIETLLLKVTI